MPDGQLRGLKKILVPELVCLLAVVLQIVTLMLFGDLQIGEPNVTKPNIPAFMFTMLGVVVIVAIDTRQKVDEL